MSIEPEDDLGASQERPLEESPADLADRLLERVGRAASVETVFGKPVAAHGRTVIPVARTYFALGAGGGRGQGKAETRGPGAGGTGSGGAGGAGGAGWTTASGYIELSPEGTRYVAFSSNRDRLLGTLAGVLFCLAALRLLWR